MELVTNIEEFSPEQIMAVKDSIQELDADVGYCVIFLENVVRT